MSGHILNICWVNTWTIIEEIKIVNPTGNQLWLFTGQIDAGAEAPILWPPNTKSRLIGKDPDAGKDWGQEEKGATEKEMVGWHHWLNGYEFEQTLGDNEGQIGELGVLQSMELQRVGHNFSFTSKEIDAHRVYIYIFLTFYFILEYSC